MKQHVVYKRELDDGYWSVEVTGLSETDKVTGYTGEAATLSCPHQSEYQVSVSR